MDILPDQLNTSFMADLDLTNFLPSRQGAVTVDAPPEAEGNDSDFLTDFCGKINRAGRHVEIIEAKAGTSEFNVATHHATLTPGTIAQIKALKKNYAFISGVVPQKPGARNARDLLIQDIFKANNPLQSAKRSGSDQIPDRTHVVFDLDLKDVYADAIDWKPDQKKDTVKEIWDTHKDAIDTALGGVWFAVYSGNGLHVHCYSSEPIGHDKKEYKQFYETLLLRLAETTGLRFDKACKDRGRPIRLPLSVNWKKQNAPMPTEVIYHNPESDSAKLFIRTFSENRKHKDEKQLEKKEKPGDKVATASRNVGSGVKDYFVEKVRRDLTFKAILEHHGIKYDPSPSGKIIAPWRVENTGSVSLNHEKKLFHDFGDTSKAGDIFTFLGLLSGLETKTNFGAVLAAARDITGTPDTPDANDYFAFFRDQLPQVTVDLLSKRMFYKLRAEWESAFNAVETLKAQAIDVGFFNKGDVKSYLSLMSHTLEPKLMIEIPEWDGIDRVKVIADCIHATNATSAEVEEIIKEWGAKLFERIENPAIQNPMLILTGAQGIGKNELVKALVSGLGVYFKMGGIGQNDKDDDLRLTKCLAWFIEEFDVTVKADVARLKEMIFREAVTFRAPYAAEDDTIPCRYSMIACCNIQDVLRDSTGNRRYRVLEVAGIDWNYPTDESPQVLAQFRAMKGFRVSTGTQATMSDYNDANRPLSKDEMIVAHFDDMMGASKPAGYLEGRATHGTREELAKTFKTSMRHVDTVLKKAGRAYLHRNTCLRIFLKGQDPRHTLSVAH